MSSTPQIWLVKNLVCILSNFQTEDFVSSISAGHSYHSAVSGYACTVVSQELGHSTIWTISRYLHASERVVEKTAKRFDQSEFRVETG